MFNHIQIQYNTKTIQSVVAQLRVTYSIICLNVDFRQIKRQAGAELCQAQDKLSCVRLDCSNWLNWANWLIWSNWLIDWLIWTQVNLSNLCCKTMFLILSCFYTTLVEMVRKTSLVKNWVKQIWVKQTKKQKSPKKLGRKSFGRNFIQLHKIWVKIVFRQKKIK